MGMVRQSWLAVKVRPFSLSIKYMFINLVISPYNKIITEEVTE